MTQAPRLPDALKATLRGPGPAGADDVPVQLPLVVLSAFIVPILVVAFYMLYVRPEVGADHFAWSISPLTTSMMLGATYLGGAYYFLVVVWSRQWRHVWLGFLPVTAFIGTLGLATILHWDLFPHERLGFQLWALLYFAVPPILPILWYRNHRLADGVALDRNGELPRLIRWAFGALGAMLAIAGTALFVAPGGAMAIWPWTLSPLTSRVVAAMYVLPGVAGVSIAYDGSWSGARYLLQAMAVTIVLMIVTVYVARADFDWGHPSSWLFVGGLFAIGALIALTYGHRYLASE